MYSSRLFACTLLVASLIGCAAQQPIASTQGTTLVQAATVTNVRDVTINSASGSGIGTIVGSVLGALVGSNIGGGTGSTVAGIGGSVAGGVAGHQLERSAGTKTVTELTVRLDNGEIRTYTIEPGESFRIGDQVRVITSNGTIRVAH
jgi:outer membrane lipoprotein SlyB